MTIASDEAKGNKPLRGLVPRRELRPVELLANGNGGGGRSTELHFLSCVQLCWDTTKRHRSLVATNQISGV